MTRKQMVFVIAVNAVVSTLITLLLVVVILPALEETPLRPAPSPTEPPLAGPTAAPIAAVTPTPSLVVHTVQPGDTISGLALHYNVPEEDIIAANHLENPNFLQVGIELIIPVGGLPQATATFTPAPTPTDTPLPFEPPSADMTATAAAAAGFEATPLPTPLPAAGSLQIVIGEIVGAGQVEQEQVVILNTGEQLADMQGWTLRDADGNVFIFPNFRLWGNGSSVTVHTRIGQDGSPPANFYWGKLEPIWSLGEQATLQNAQGEVVATYVVGQ